MIWPIVCLLVALWLPHRDPAIGDGVDYWPLAWASHEAPEAC